MKRIATLAVILMMGLTASAHSIRYFTESQAIRTVRYLNAQNEMMIYCGYDYELETYVLINEVWMERVNSAYYEIWVYGYDAYTGDEIYMPLDLGCVWLFSAGRIYNAAQYLRFHASVRTPSFTWYIPPYRPFTRVMHRPGYIRTYHYDVHRYGWMPPAYTYGPGMPPPPLPYYYMRHPGAPAPHPSNTWTPGVDRPVVTEPSTAGRSGTAGRVITGGSNSGSSSGVRTGNNTGNSRGSSTGSSSGTRGNAEGTSTGSSRGTSTGNAGSSRGNAESTSTGSSRGTSTGNAGSSRGNAEGTSTGSSRGTSTGNAGSSRGNAEGTSTGSSRGTSTTGTTPTRGNTTAASSSRGTTTDKPAAAPSTDKPKTNSRGTSTTSRSTSSRGTSTGTTGSSRGTGSTRGNSTSSR